MSNPLKVDDWETTSFFWKDQDGFRTSGSAAAVFKTTNPSTGAVQYLQAGGTTLGASPHNFPLTLVGNYWEIPWQTPGIMAGHLVSVIATHSDTELSTDVADYSVSSASLDDIAGTIATADVEQEPFLPL